MRDFDCNFALDSSMFIKSARYYINYHQNSNQNTQIEPIITTFISELD